MCDEPDGRPSSTGSVELSRPHIEEIGYLSSSTIMYDKIQNGNMTNGFPGNNSDQVYMEIAEQPQARGFRFRYPSEGSSHGGLQGELSARHKKSYPAVRIRNYNGPCRIMVSLVTDEQVPRPHAHELVGKNCKNGICVVEMKGNSEMIATFPNLGIQHVTKKKVVQILTERILESINVHRQVQTANFSQCQSLITDDDKTSSKKQATDQAKHIKLNVVRLMFQGYLMDVNGGFTRMINPVLTRPIYDSKSPGAAALKICRMDKHAGCCSGNEEVFLLCDKVQKDDIHVRFFEEDEDGAVRWEGFGDFGPTDVHRQYAIVFKTPRYWNPSITKPVTVQVQLKRMSDNETSEPKQFTYYPMQLDKEEVGKKRRKVLPFGGGDGGSFFGGNLGGVAPGMGGGRNAGGNMFGTPGFPGFMGGHGLGGYQAMGLELDDSSEESDDDDDSVGGRRGRTAHHTFAPLGSQASGPPASGRGRSSRKMAPASAAMEESSSESGSSSMEETDTSSEEEDDVDGAPRELMTTALAVEPEINRPSQPQSAMAVLDHTVKRFPTVENITTGVDEMKLVDDRKSQRKDKNKDSKRQRNDKCKGEKGKEVLSAQLVWKVAERTNAGLNNYAATGDVRHMLLIQRHLMSVQDINGDTALHVAIINRQIQVVQNLLNISTTLPDCNVVNKPNFLLQTPLHLAVLTGQPHVVEMLLNHHAIVPAVDRHGNTPIHIAAEKGDSQCLGNILKRLRGPKPGPCPLSYQGYTPLILAVTGGHLSCVKMLVAAGAEIDQADGTSGRTPLHHAVEADNVAIAGHLLLEGEADPNVPTFDGNTALHLAVGRNQVGMAALLITAGADPHAENLDPAEDTRDEEEEFGLDMDLSLPTIQEQNSSGTSPLDLAVGNEKMLKVLRGEPYSSVSSPTTNVVLPPSFPSIGDTRTVSLEESYDSRLSSGTTSSLTSISPSQLFSQRGDLHKLDALSRTSLAKILDPVSPGKDWRSLAERLAMSSLVAPLRMHPSPTKALLDNFEAVEGSMQQLLDGLVAMDRQDAVKVVRESFKYHRHATFQGNGKEMDEECRSRVESGIGSMREEAVESSLH